MTVQRAFLISVVVALLSLLLLVRVDGTEAWLRVGLDVSHVPIFAAVTMLLAVVLRQVGWPVPVGRLYAVAFALAFAIGVAIEHVQSLSGRPASLFDVGSNAAGAAIGLSLLALYERAGRRARLDRAAGWVVLGAGLAGLLFAAWRPLEAARAYLHRASGFPVLAAFRAPLDLYFVETEGLEAEIAELPEPWALLPGERALRIVHDAARSPAVQLKEASPDWRGYRALAVDVTNAGDAEIRFVVRVLDETHDWSHEDRFNQSFAVPARTRRTFRFPLDAVGAAPADRPMDLSRVANVMIFGQGPAVAGEIYVSRLWLE
jgi:VanZ family protein